MKGLLIVIGVAGLSLGCRSGFDKTAESRPNILLILADDMGYGDVSNIGNEYLKTPNLDEMSRNSINIKNFYVSPVCAPTRASLLTGRYHQKVGVRSVTNGFEIMDPDAVTLAEILKQQDYRTAIFGKWHLGEYFPSVPQAQGFDEFLGFRTGHTSDYYDAVLEHNGKQEQTNGYITDMLSDKAIDFMNVQSEQPFFCYLAYNAPHSPLQIEEDKFQRFIEMGLDEKTSRVYAMVENIDENVGKIFRQLETDGKLEKTIVIFLSDNGPISGWQVPQERMRYNAGLRDQKFTAFEGGIRSQCYWMWKDHWQPFFDEKSVAAHIDIVPTIASLLNIQLQDSLKIDGISLRSILESHAFLDSERIFFEDFEYTAVKAPELFRGGIARKGDWKMYGASELYNLSEDPGEQSNVADEFPEILESLNREYENYYQESYFDNHFLPVSIPVGFAEENPVKIKSHHGRAAGNVQFMGYRGNYNESFGTHPYGVDGDWTTNWKKEGDMMTWNVDFTEVAQYEIGITANGKIGLNTCVFDIQFDGALAEITLPQFSKNAEWQYFPLLTATASDTATVSIRLKQMSETDSLNINELVITRTN